MYVAATPWGKVNPAAWGLSGPPGNATRVTGMRRPRVRSALSGKKKVRRPNMRRLYHDGPIPWATINPAARGYLGEFTGYNGSPYWGSLTAYYSPHYLGYGLGDSELSGLFSFIGKAIKGIGKGIGAVAKGAFKVGKFAVTKVAPYAAAGFLGVKGIGLAGKLIGGLIHKGQPRAADQVATQVTQAEPSQEAQATIYNTPDMARNPTHASIYREISDFAINTALNRMIPTPAGAAADVYAGPTADTGLPISTAAAAGLAPAGLFGGGATIPILLGVGLVLFAMTQRQTVTVSRKGR